MGCACRVATPIAGAPVGGLLALGLSGLLAWRRQTRRKPTEFSRRRS
jgi:MYXO-CTERM domain-containing protein